jgi:hypothetical protein
MLYDKTVFSSGCVGLNPDRRMCDKRVAFRDSKCHGLGCQVREHQNKFKFKKTFEGFIDVSRSRP